MGVISIHVHVFFKVNKQNGNSFLFFVVKNSNVWGGVYVPGNANTIRIPGIADIIWVNTRSDGSKPT